MAFDLLFFKNKTAMINLNDVVQFFNQNPYFSTKPYDVDQYLFIYRNPLSSVNFTISYNEQDELITDVVFDESFNYSYTIFSINYLRPSFFALEAMPIIEAFSKKLGLLIYDLQSLTEEKNNLKQYSLEYLIDSYNKNNEIASIEFNKQLPLLYTSIEKSQYVYQYLQNKEHLEELYENVPDIDFMKNYQENNIYTVFSWDNAISTLIPKVDFVLIIRKVKVFSIFKKEELSLVPYDTLLSTFSEHLEKCDNDLYLINNTPETLKLFYQLPKIDYDDYELIKYDDFVDINLQD